MKQEVAMFEKHKQGGGSGERGHPARCRRQFAGDRLCSYANARNEACLLGLSGRMPALPG
jgi:hypothetical protein